jgi:hypothetical protein|tara:strand:+ start:167 stop:430 length:264 start_codon:yes stop_codon:yes gene_type:complete
MQKIDIKLILIITLLALNVYQSISNYKPKNQIDVSNVFLKDKIESLNRDVNTISLKLKLLDNIQVKLDNLKQDIEDLNTKINNNLSK